MPQHGSRQDLDSDASSDFPAPALPNPAKAHVADGDNKPEPPTKARKASDHACSYCRRSHMTCDLQRPCTRCIKRNIGHLCHDEPRKPLLAAVPPSLPAYQNAGLPAAPKRLFPMSSKLAPTSRNTVYPVATANNSSGESKSHTHGPTLTRLEVYTDSGYGSHGARTISYSGGHFQPETILEVVEQAGAAEAGRDSVTSERVDDSKTVYSDTASLQDPRIDDYVVAFADELSNALPADFSREDLEGISDALPATLEAFASRISYQASGKLERQLRYLVHRYRLRIVDLLRRRLSREFRGDGDVDDNNDDTPESPRTGGVEMNYHEKVAPWLNNCDTTNPDDAHEPENKDYHESRRITFDEDLEGELPDLNELPEISRYRQALTQSPAYQWLLSSLNVLRMLAVPGGRTSIQTEIRQRIIDELRPSKRFSRGDPCEAIITFNIDWNPFQFKREQQYDVPLQDVLECAVTLTGEGNEVWATTCLDYITHVWPESGPALLQFLQAAFKDIPEPWRARTPLRTRIACASLECQADPQDNLLIKATGDIFTIAEIGEQLAWLGAAFRSSPDDTIMSCIPYIEEISLDASHHHNYNRIQSWRCRLGFFLARTRADPTAQGACWRGLFNNPVIVEGYPIPRRRGQDAGAQITLDIAGALINSNRFVKWAGNTFIKGGSALLVATKVVEETVFWHLVYNEDGSYISYEDPRVPRWPESADPFVLESMANHHHIVGWCSRVISHAGSTSVDYSKITWSGLPGPTQSCAMEKVTITGGQFVSAGISCVLGIKDRPLHINFGDDYFGMLQNISDRHFVMYNPDDEDRRAWLLDGASTLLHLLRASIQNFKDDRRFQPLLCSPDNIELYESSQVPTLGSRASTAWEILSNKDNLGIPLYPSRTSAWEESTRKHGFKAENALKEKSTYFTVQDRIDQICHALLQITAHHDDVHTQSGVGLRLRSTPRRQLEGFEFTDIATRQGTLWPKVATLKTTGQGWVDFARAIHAPTLFASGFGDLFTPAPSSSAGNMAHGGRVSSCSRCYFNVPLPKGKYYLAATTSDLRAILCRRGNMRLKPWRLVDDIHWYTPDLTCEPCACSHQSSKGKKHDRIQVLLPSSFPKLWGRESPRNLVADGAVVFGHSNKFPLRWGASILEPPLHVEVLGADEMDVDEAAPVVEDSGIGSSLASGSASQPKSENKEDWLSEHGWGSTRLATQSSSNSSSGLYRLGNQQFINHSVGVTRHKRRVDGDDVRGALVKKARGFRETHPENFEAGE